MNGHQAQGRKATAVATVLAFGLTMASGGFSGVEAAVQPAESPLAIAHDPLACVNTDYAPKVDAAVAPGKDFEKGYVYFKAAGTEDYYYAVMKGVPENLGGVLPRPLPETRSIDYYVRATDVQDLSKKTQDYTPPVVPGNACKVQGVPVGREGAGLTIGLTKEGQNPIPPGFNKKDIAFVILFSGAVVSLAAAMQGAGGAAAGAGKAAAAAGKASAGAGGGGGVSTGVLVVGGLAVAGGVAAAVASNNKGASNTNTPTPTSTPTPTPTATATPTPTPMPLAFVEADATWSGLGDVDVQILDPSGTPVGTALPVGCESQSSRTERVILQGTLTPGTYQVMLTGKTCGPGTPASIAVALSVQSQSGPKCSNTFVTVPVGSTVQGCTFTLP